jgi:hypothetical protein
LAGWRAKAAALSERGYKARERINRLSSGGGSIERAAGKRRRRPHIKIGATLFHAPPTHIHVARLSNVVTIYTHLFILPSTPQPRAKQAALPARAFRPPFNKASLSLCRGNNSPGEGEAPSFFSLSLSLCVCPHSFAQAPFHRGCLSTGTQTPSLESGFHSVDSRGHTSRRKLSSFFSALAFPPPQRPALLSSSPFSPLLFSLPFFLHT